MEYSLDDINWIKVVDCIVTVLESKASMNPPPLRETIDKVFRDPNLGLRPNFPSIQLYTYTSFLFFSISFRFRYAEESEVIFGMIVYMLFFLI